MASEMGEVCCEQAPPIAGHNAGQRKKQSKLAYFYNNSSSSSSETLAVDQNNNSNSNQSLKQSSKSSAPNFKHCHNAPAEDLEGLRKLLIEERDQQLASASLDRDELEFYRADFERMLSDDWLVTRFLLRGKKAHERLGGDQLRLAQEAEHCQQEAPATSEQQQRQQIQARRAIHLDTLELIRVCAKFRFDYRVNNQTREREFPPEWVRVNGLFHYKPDRAGNPTVYLRVVLHKPKLIQSAEARHQFKRYLLYTLERCDQQLHNRPGKAICCLFDMTNVAFENIDLELTSWMIKSFKSCSPKLVCYVIIYNPPWFFTATFKLICNTLLSNSKRQSVKFVHNNELLEYIDHDNLPPYLQTAICNNDAH